MGPVDSRVQTYRHPLDRPIPSSVQSDTLLMPRSPMPSPPPASSTPFFKGPRSKQRLNEEGTSTKQSQLSNLELLQQMHQINDDTSLPFGPMTRPGDSGCGIQSSRIQGKKDVRFWEPPQWREAGTNHVYEEIKDSTPRSRLFMPPDQGRTPRHVLHQAQVPDGAWGLQHPPPPPAQDGACGGAVSGRESHGPWRSLPGQPYWTSLRYLGPRFPSMEREIPAGPLGKEMNKIANEQSLIKNLIDTELSNVHKLEQEINCQIYGEGTYNTPCSSLKDTYIATATTSPEMLSSDPRERLEIMKQVRGMLLDAKTRHQETLRKLQVPPRRSARLQHKPRPDYIEYDDEY